MQYLKPIAMAALFLTAFSALLFCAAVGAQALPNAACTWTAPADGTPRNWSDGSNWSCGAVPGAGDTAIIDGGGIVINVDAPVTVQHLTFATNAELRGYQTLTVTVLYSLVGAAPVRAQTPAP